MLLKRERERGRAWAHCNERKSQKGSDRDVVCVCVCVRERERQRVNKRDARKERETLLGHFLMRRRDRKSVREILCVLCVH